MHASSPNGPLIFQPPSMPNESDIIAALEEVANSDIPNYAAIAEKYNIHRSTLSRRARGITQSRKEICSQQRQLLTDTQEEFLITYINELSNKGLHVTPGILTNLVESLLQKAIGKNWTYEFVERHGDKITSAYLKGFDRQRKIADNEYLIKHFYLNVRLKFSTKG
jgi:hypothetical protein